MSSRYLLTPAAKQDFLEIRRYVLQRFGRIEEQAVRARIVRAFEVLAEHPGIGRARPELWPEPYQFWPVGPSLIAYRSDVRPVQIVRIARASRDWQELGSRGR